MFGSFRDLAFLGVAAGTGVALDPDAQSYITAVETVDGQALEAGVRTAINDFVVGCKADGIWTAIKASCILAGARTLNGALRPLVGAAPTNFNFVSGDYNRKTGLVGDAATKYLRTSYSMTAANLNNAHLYAYASQINFASLTNQHLIGGASPTELWFNGIAGATFFVYRANEGTGGVNMGTNAAGSYAWSRNSSALKTRLAAGNLSTSADASTGVAVGQVTVFARDGGFNAGGHRIAVFTCGESLNLALLDARVTALINTFAAVIP
jgi:hypothetical protein